MTEDIIYGWHFLDSRGRAYGHYRPPAVGIWEPPIDKPEPCVRGYHGSPTILKALVYASGPILGRCEYRAVVRHADGDKWAARERRCIARVDASRLLRYFAAHVAEEAMRRFGWTDPRSWAATQAARDYADRKIDSAARSAAWSAAWSAAEAEWSAARSAAWSAAWSAEWSAARSAAEAEWSAAERWLDSAALDLDGEAEWEVPGE